MVFGIELEWYNPHHRILNVKSVLGLLIKPIDSSIIGPNRAMLIFYNNWQLFCEKVQFLRTCEHEEQWQLDGLSHLRREKDRILSGCQAWEGFSWLFEELGQASQ